jgi:hypothetical protein
LPKAIVFIKRIMLKDFENFFSMIDHPTPPPDLLRGILSRIESEKEAMAVRNKIFWLSIFSFASLLVVAFSWLNFQNAASESGLFQLVSLMFTDFSVMISHYQDFLISVTEALPILAIVGLLAGTLIFVESFLTLLRNARFVYKSNS